MLVYVERSPSARQNSMWVVVDKLPKANFSNLRSVTFTSLPLDLLFFFLTIKYLSRLK